MENKTWEEIYSEVLSKIEKINFLLEKVMTDRRNEKKLQNTFMVRN